MNDSEMIDEMAERIEKLEERFEQLECATLNAETIGHVAELRCTAAEQAECIEKLEAALLDVIKHLDMCTTSSALGRCRLWARHLKK